MMKILFFGLETSAVVGHRRIMGERALAPLDIVFPASIRLKLDIFWELEMEMEQVIGIAAAITVLFVAAVF